ncbi:glycosyltransferase family 4 protein [Desulfocurvibacter africanus]|uniref:Glycosyl transferase group 1 n=1 Tax=Desulfocurvibacter africanus subsp. africanus str. Walvis Bay TaxID=690850 RepID=F3YZF9_DESAF|nr:glycosyltransferase family 4 protein [Desulfocurvibacter africanus]EGJ51988.1 glycosyl transferase group 1 [Desulfocurvibacter africanus subsp. africanus str. Walvis Bay]
MKILFVSHDAFPAGAQHSFARITGWMARNTDCSLFILSLSGGALLPKLQAIAPTLVLDAHLAPNASEDDVLKALLAFTAGKPDIIFGNTCVSGKIYPILARLGCPIITRIAELESALARYADGRTQEALFRHTNRFVAVSQATRANLARHGVPPERISVIRGFIENTATNLAQEQRHALLTEFNLAPDTTILWGCGSVSLRKGADLFLEVGERLQRKGLTNFHLFWVGPASDDNIGPFFLRKERSAARDLVTFLGPISSPCTLFQEGDVFLLTSREDPFPLVCLEAAERCVPSICFAASGGAPEFVGTDAGCIVEPMTPEAMAEKAFLLAKDEDLRKSLGRQARKKVLARHTGDTTGPLIHALCRAVAAVGRGHGCSTPPESVTGIIRTAGERTTQACRELLAHILPSECIHVVQARPFSQAIRKSFELALTEDRKWTFVLDADVLLRTEGLVELVDFAERQQANTFVVQGLVYDKFFGILRPAGIHLYRTKHLARGLTRIPAEGSTLRPESAMIDAMVRDGYLFWQTDAICGLHDFEQDYASIMKKCFLQARKHAEYLPHAMAWWEHRKAHDKDFMAALAGVQAGSNHQGEVFVDADFLSSCIRHALDTGNYPEKPLPDPAALGREYVQNQLAAVYADQLHLQLQNIMFPPARWKHVYGDKLLKRMQPGVGV